MAVNPRINVDEEDERKSNSFTNILKLAARVAISKSDAGAIAVQQDMDKRDVEAKEYTDRALSYVDRIAMPKIMSRRASIAKEQNFAKRLKSQYKMSPDAIKTLAAGGLGSLEDWYGKIADLGIQGETLNNWVITSQDVVDTNETVTQFLNKRFDLTKELLNDNPDSKETALFSSLFADPRTMAKTKLENMPIYGDFNAQDLYRFTKAGGFEDDSQNKPAEVNLELQAKDIEDLTNNKFVRAGVGFAKVITPALRQTALINQYSKGNAVFHAYMVEYGADFNNIVKDATGSPYQYNDSNQTDSKVKKAMEAYENARLEYVNITTGQGYGQADIDGLNERKSRELRNITYNTTFKSKLQLREFLDSVTKSGTIPDVFRKWDTFKVIVNNEVVEIRYDQRNS